MFAITKHHAARLARHPNELHPEHQGRYAEVITSDVAEPDALIRRFKTEAYPMVAVSVGMLDTGVDCREVLHLVLCRRVRSPILYRQMRGRGTRTAPHIEQISYLIYLKLLDEEEAARELKSRLGAANRTCGQSLHQCIIFINI